MNQLLQDSINRASKLSSGIEFEVKDLFTGVEWKNFSINDRIDLGKNFLRYMQTHSATIKIQILPKSSNNHYHYKKQ